MSATKCATWILFPLKIQGVCFFLKTHDFFAENLCSYDFLANFAESAEADIHFYKRFLLNPPKEIANFKVLRREQSENAHACRLSTPRQGVSISDKAWEWTVYLVLGVWRCLLGIDRNIIPRFCFIPKQSTREWRRHMKKQHDKTFKVSDVHPGGHSRGLLQR